MRCTHNNNDVKTTGKSLWKPVAENRTVQIHDVYQRVQRLPELCHLTDRCCPLAANFRVEQFATCQAVFRSSPVAEVDRLLRRAQLRSAEEHCGADRPDRDKTGQRPEQAVDCVRLRPESRLAARLQFGGRASGQLAHGSPVYLDRVEPVVGRVRCRVVGKVSLGFTPQERRKPFGATQLRILVVSVSGKLRPTVDTFQSCFRCLRPKHMTQT